MADNKKYYYLKLKDNFFDTDEMIILESMPDGYTYSNILLKLYLRSLKYEGRLMFNQMIPFNSTMLAKVTRHSTGDVEKAIKVFKELGLIEIMDNGAIYIADIQNYIGNSSTEADRKRTYRKKIDQEKGQMSVKCPDKNPPELEIEIEKELEIEIEDIVGQDPTPPINSDLDLDKKQKLNDLSEKASVIVTYLNQKIGSKYKPSSKKTKEHISARLGEGFSVDDFKQVIDIKAAEWLNDTKMQKFLRPETLFGTKFESYLNQKAGGKHAKDWRGNAASGGDQSRSGFFDRG
ncbi:hypothetical protein JQ662_000224 [Listeria monocytogenes]|nr:hypothetical protein [Listeria monocytogenes]